MSRSRIIALQGAVVGVLLVVVYLTILRPNDDGSVSGVNAPGTPPGEIATKPSDRQTHRVRPRHPQNRPRPRRAGSSAAATTGVAGGGPTGLVPSAPSTPTLTPAGVSPPGGGPGGESPTDDQYNDTLARLNAALR